MNNIDYRQYKVQSVIHSVQEDAIIFSSISNDAGGTRKIPLGEVIEDFSELVEMAAAVSLERACPVNHVPWEIMRQCHAIAVLLYEAGIIKRPGNDLTDRRYF